MTPHSTGEFRIDEEAMERTMRHEAAKLWKHRAWVLFRELGLGWAEFWIVCAGALLAGTACHFLIWFVEPDWSRVSALLAIGSGGIIGAVIARVGADWLVELTKTTYERIAADWTPPTLKRGNE